MFNLGILGNPNHKIKLFIKDEIVSTLVKSNTIYLYGVDSKIQTLLAYYLPSTKVIDDFDDLSKYKYLITSISSSLGKSNVKQYFRPV